MPHHIGLLRRRTLLDRLISGFVVHLSVRHLVMIGPSPSAPGPWTFDVMLRDR